jgi:hypothetical protein
MAKTHDYNYRGGYMNVLEGRILQGAENAQKRYGEMSGYEWLSHAPESFIQIFVALELHSLRYKKIYIDATYNKLKKAIKTDADNPIDPMEHEGQRPDIAIFAASTKNLRAIVEIKKAGHALNLPPSVRSDANK